MRYVSEKLASVAENLSSRKVTELTPAEIARVAGGMEHQAQKGF